MGIPDSNQGNVYISVIRTSRATRLNGKNRGAAPLDLAAVLAPRVFARLHSPRDPRVPFDLFLLRLLAPQRAARVVVYFCQVVGAASVWARNKGRYPSLRRSRALRSHAQARDAGGAS